MLYRDAVRTVLPWPNVAMTIKYLSFCTQLYLNMFYNPFTHTLYSIIFHGNALDVLHGQARVMSRKRTDGVLGCRSAMLMFIQFERLP